MCVPLFRVSDNQKLISSVSAAARSNQSPIFSNQTCTTNSSALSLSLFVSLCVSLFPSFSLTVSVRLFPSGTCLSAKPCLTTRMHTHTHTHAQLCSITDLYSTHAPTSCLQPSSVTVIGNILPAMGTSSCRIYITQVHPCGRQRMHARTHTLTRVRTGPQKTASDISHLISVPLSSHNTFRTRTHPHAHSQKRYLRRRYPQAAFQPSRNSLTHRLRLLC